MQSKIPIQRQNYLAPLIFRSRAKTRNFHIRAADTIKRSAASRGNRSGHRPTSAATPVASRGQCAGTSSGALPPSFPPEPDVPANRIVKPGLAVDGVDLDGDRTRANQMNRRARILPPRRPRKRCFCHRFVINVKRPSVSR